MFNLSRVKLCLPLTLCALAVGLPFHAATAASAGQTFVIPHIASGVNRAVITHPVLPFSVPTVTNVAAAAPTQALTPSVSDLAQVRSYVPKALADAPDFAQAYQQATQLKAWNDYKLERTAHVAEIVKGDTSEKRIALTFDDGPHGQKTLDLISELKSLNVPATFFVVGKQAVKFPTIVQLEVINGNEVGNHTFDHVNLTQIPPAMVPYELDECDAVLRRILGESPRFFRPPGGNCNAEVLKEAAAHGYITTLWTDDPGDFNRLPSNVILQRLVNHLRPGGIILLHDGIPETMQMLPQFVAEARRQGYTFVTMSDLAAGSRQ